MAELLDPNGVWTAELLALMIPVAIEVEADTAMMYFGASAAAVSIIGGKKGADGYTAGLQRTKQNAKAAMRAARGLPPDKPAAKPGETAAEQFMDVMAQMGMRPRRKHARPEPKQTKQHRPKPPHRGR